MKILVFTSYLTIPSLKGFNKNQSGFGYMVANITLGLAKNKSLNINVLTQSNFTKAGQHENLFILKRSFTKMLCFLRFNSIYSALIERNKYKKIGFGRLLLYKITCNYFNSICTQYDVVHIHGVSPYTFDAIDYCIKNKIKGVVTIHGINYLNRSIGLSTLQKEKEKYFIKKITESENLTLSVISNGIKKRVIESLNLKPNNIELIPNFHDFNEANVDRTQNIKTKYNIPKSSKIILSVGNYSRNKNQNQLIDAFNLLNNNDTYLILVGTGTENFLNSIEKKNLNQRVIACGQIAKKDLPNYYLSSDVLAVTSISEGFGLPMIEALFFGLPVITFKDIDAVEDIFDNNNLMLVEERTTKCYAKGIEKALNKKWDSKMLKNSVRKFDANTILSQYQKTLRKSKT
ncbi:MAG: hypothetical protein CMD35_08340 [Flavobacteriales bacterium]|nr:hypothetical protein [Flavobacteriales bacterium]